MRLDKIVADAGLFARSEADTLIKEGHVTVGGMPALRGADKYDPERERIRVNGNILEYREFRYFMLNKPRGYVSATENSLERTVMELLDASFSRLRLFPAGRLDKDAEGLLLLTNDGGFAHRITSPRGKVEKRYFVQFDGAVADGDVRRFAEGITLGSGEKCLPATLELTQEGAYISLYEGKYHQVKRMMAAIGKHVIYLKRVAIGGLRLDESLKPGEYRELYDEINLVCRNRS